MLILPPGHARSVTARRRVGRRERWLIGIVVLLLASGAIALVISLARQGRVTSRNCVEVTVPAATGAGEIYRCGAEARALCASAHPSGAGATVLDRAISRECAKARIPAS